MNDAKENLKFLRFLFQIVKYESSFLLPFVYFLFFYF